MTSTPDQLRNRPRHLAIFVSFSGTGGVERVTLNLLQGLSLEPDLRVDLLLVVAKRGIAPVVPWPNIRVINLGTTHSQMAIPALVRYLKKERPDALMVAKDRAIRASILAHGMAKVETRLFGQLHMNMQGYVKDKFLLNQWLRILPMRWLFPRLDKIICVSEGVAQDTREITGMPPEKVIALKNPVITPEIAELADQPVDHPWFDGEGRIILAVGRLSPEKDFATLLRAFALVDPALKTRLVLLGDGPLRDELLDLQHALGLQDRVEFIGFRKNPYAYMKRASVLVLSSRWEGAPTVLIEAMSLGVPCVSTDCDFGPREIFESGQFGRLTPVGDSQALAQAIEETLTNPLSPDVLKTAVEGYSIARSARSYLNALF
jgi:glycosyltransferase involved in cell wall biosynthesis